MPQNWNFSPDYFSRSQSILEVALNHIGAYRPWRVFDPGPDYPVDTRYAALPALTKKDIREHFPQGFVPPDRDVNRALADGEIAFVQTSGTSDDKVTNIWNQKWWDASERASWKLNSYASRLATGKHREAILVNPLNVGIISDNSDLPMEKRRLSRFLYLNEKTNLSSWSDEHMDRMITELSTFEPVVLEGNPSLLAKLCRYAATANKKVFQPGLIVLTYECPTHLHLRQIRRVFNTPIASSYGTTETGYVFMQCEEGKFHQNSEFCRVDFQPLKPEHGGPDVGRLLVTTFGNPWYYLVRFDVGDLARIDQTGRCPCGRNSGLILSGIEGRVAGLTLTARGRLVTLRELDNVLSILDGIDEYQLFQPAPAIYNLRLVSQRADKEALSAQASKLLRRLYGQGAKVTVTFEPYILPEGSGKFLLSKADFPIKIDDYIA